MVRHISVPWVLELSGTCTYNGIFHRSTWMRWRRRGQTRTGSIEVWPITLTKELSSLERELLDCVINRPWAHDSKPKQLKSERPCSHEFQAHVTTDLVSPETVCDWCGQTAERRFTAIGGSSHNKTGAFCSPCGQLFLEKTVNC